MPEKNDVQQQPSVSFLQVTASILAAFFGVQSEKNRQRDFTHGKPIHYIVIGIISTIMFILVIWGIVKIVLALATA